MIQERFQEAPTDSLTWTHAKHDGVEISVGLCAALDRRDLQSVFDRLAGRRGSLEHISEGRSTILKSHSGLLHDGIKIKGAGLNGGTVDFSRKHKGAYDLPHYDFEGNYTADAARAYQRAFAGGMSFQQAVNEFRVSHYLTDHGFATYPPIGYGHIRRGNRTSWFCLLNAPWQPHWDWYSRDTEHRLLEQVPRFTARAQLDLQRLGLTLVLFGVARVDGELLRKDLHTARFESTDDSFMSRACYCFFDMNLILAYFANPRHDPGISGWVERAWCEYVGELCGDSPDYSDVVSLKRVLVTLKRNSNLSLEERLAFIHADPIARRICTGMMSVDERDHFPLSDRSRTPVPCR